MINLHAPDFYTGYRIYMRLIDLYYTGPQAFREDVNLTKIFGCFPGMTWNGGSVFYGTIKNKAIIEEISSFYRANGIPLKLTLTNPILTENDVHDRYCNSIVQLMENDINEILVSNDFLEDYLREKYPCYKFDRSIVAGTISQDMDDIDTYVKLLESNKYETIVLPRRKTKDINFLKQIPMEYRQNIEILLNDFCPLSCSRLGEHYEAIGQMQVYNFKYDTESEICLHRCLYPVVERANDMISYDEIKEIYEPLGYSEFKISGRWNKNSIALNVTRYLIKPEYQFDVLSYLLEAAYSPDQVAEI